MIQIEREKFIFLYQGIIFFLIYIIERTLKSSIKKEGANGFFNFLSMQPEIKQTNQLRRSVS
jgi:hypothetical protein